MKPAKHSHRVVIATLGLTLLLGACATAPDPMRAPAPRAAIDAAPAPSKGTSEPLAPTLVPLRPQPPGATAEVKRDRNSELTIYALSLVGVKYKFGGNSAATGFDCSGFVNHVFGEIANYVLPRNSEAIAQRGVTVDRNELEPGDLVFYNTRSRANSHVGIYLGNNTFVHAPSRGKSVEIVDMTENYWRKRFNGARRVLADPPPTIASSIATNTAQKVQIVTPGLARSTPVTRQQGQPDGMPLTDEQ